MRLTDRITSAWDVVEIHIRRHPRKYSALGFVIIFLPSQLPTTIAAAKWAFGFLPKPSMDYWKQMTLPFSWNWVSAPIGLGLMALVWWETRKQHHQPPGGGASPPGLAFASAGDLESRVDNAESEAEDARGAMAAALNELQQRTAERDALRKSVDEVSQDRERIRGQLAGERDGFEQAWLTCKKAFGVYRLVQFAQRVADNIARHNATADDAHKLPDVHVTIRFGGYIASDLALVGQIESILKEHTTWKTTREVAVNPALNPSGEFKVIFESAVLRHLTRLAWPFKKDVLSMRRSVFVAILIAPIRVI